MKKVKLNIKADSVRILTKNELLSEVVASGTGESGTNVSEGVHYDPTTDRCYAQRVCLDGDNTATVSCSGTGQDCHLTSVEIGDERYPIGVRCNDSYYYCDRILLPSGFDPGSVTSNVQEACNGKSYRQPCAYRRGIDIVYGRCVYPIDPTGLHRLYCDPTRERGGHDTSD